PLYISINSPLFHSSDLSQAVIHIAKSAILGRFSSVVYGNSFSPLETTSHNAPKIEDFFSSNSFQKVFSSLRFSSEILGRLITIERSSKSGLCAMSSIPFKIVGRMILKTDSSLVVYNSLTDKPPPVDILQRLSLIGTDKPLKLS